jgi:hypothetical protein
MNKILFLLRFLMKLDLSLANELCQTVGYEHFFYLA